MQETLERIGRLRVGGATVTLRMSIGIHSGAFDFFLVGDSHRELIITGPAASTAVAMESVADAGEIALSPATVDLIGARHAGQRKGDGWLLKHAPGVAAAPAPDVGDVSDIDLPSCLPVELRKQLLVEQGEAEHRSISVAFLQFSGTDDLLASRGPAALADALHDLVSNVQSACERFAVTFFATDINADGGKVILVTGAPWSGGNDEERLLRAVRMIMDRPGDIAVRIGVNSGRTFTCDFGPAYRRTYQIYGDAVNLAARVMAKGQPGQALATADTLSRTRTAYELEELEPFMVKGKAEPVHASIVGAIVGSKEVERAGTPLVGRDEEMAALTDAADSARRGQGRVVELIGEPGIGKSRLVEELRGTLGDPIVLGRVRRVRVVDPYFPFRGLMHGLLDIAREAIYRRRRTHAATQCRRGCARARAVDPLLGPAFGLGLQATPETSKLDERFVPDRTAETLIQLLTALRGGPTLFVFDDVHWMDEASVGVLTLVPEQVAERPWLVLVTRRDVTTGFAAAAGPHVVVLRPLPLSGERGRRARQIGDRGPAASSPRPRGAHRAIGREPVLPERARLRSARRRCARRAPRLGRGSDGGQHRPPRAERTHRAPVRSGPRCQLRDQPLGGGAPRGDSVARRRPLEPPRGIPRRRRARYAPVPPRPDPRRRLRGSPLPPTAGAARAGRRDHRAAGRPEGRRRGRAPVPALLPRPRTSRRPGGTPDRGRARRRDLRQRRGGDVLRARARSSPAPRRSPRWRSRARAEALGDVRCG